MSNALKCRSSENVQENCVEKLPLSALLLKMDKVY